MKMHRVVACLAVVAVLAVAALLSSCGGGQSTQYVFVADNANNRVLVYDAPFTANQSAIVALGQGDISTNEQPDPPTAASLSGPSGVAVDNAGNLYVSDFGNCRVLQFKPPFSTGMSATLAIGQISGATNLTTGCPSAAAASATVGMPSANAIDSAGNLWVVDNFNSRVLNFPAPVTAGETASIAIGQANTSATGCNNGGTGLATLCGPTDLKFDSAGNLWVADTGNNRVLMYPLANLTTGGSATVELGQPAGATAFTSSTADNGGVSTTSLGAPGGLAFDLAGNLWVTDALNARVLMYPTTNLKSNGAAATLEVGQPAATAFTSNTPNNGGIGPSTLSAPGVVTVDSSGNVYVTDIVNNRTMVFEPPISNGMNATLVIGQPDFTQDAANNGGESAATQSEPAGITASTSAMISTGTGASSTPITTSGTPPALAAPTGFSAASPANKIIAIWTPESAATSYNLSWTSNSGNLLQSGSVNGLPATANTYTMAATNGRPYTLSLTAVSGSVTSAPSNTVSLTGGGSAYGCTQFVVFGGFGGGAFIVSNADKQNCQGGTRGVPMVVDGRSTTTDNNGYWQVDNLPTGGPYTIIIQSFPYPLDVYGVFTIPFNGFTSCPGGSGCPGI